MSEEFFMETFTRGGLKFQVALYYDYDADAPWDREEGHGPVRYISDRNKKKPGERLMHNRAHDIWAYDWAAAVRLAKKDGWGLGDEALAELRAKLGREPKKGEIIEDAVQADFDHLDGYLREQWFYCGVAVRSLGPDGGPREGKFEHAVWGVDYGLPGDYWREVANDLADEILCERCEAWRNALREARERRHWAERGIPTVSEGTLYY